VFQTDCPLEEMNIFGNGPEHDWQDFKSRTSSDKLYFEYRVMA